MYPLLLTILCALAQKSDQADLNHRLFAAIRAGQATRVMQLLTQGADPNAREVLITKPDLSKNDPGGKPYPGQTALIEASDEGDVRIVELLLSKGAKPNGRGIAGWTPLISAATRDRLEVARKLLARGARPDERNDYGDTALVFAVNSERPDMINLLLDHGANINGGTAETPLCYAAYNGMTVAVKALLKRGADPNFHRGQSMTPLESAEANYSSDAAKLIAAAGDKRRPAAIAKKEEGVERAAFDIERKQEDAAQTAAAAKFASERVLTEDDRAVIETSLLYLLHHDELRRRNSEATRIALVDTSISGGAGIFGVLRDDSINQGLSNEQAANVDLPLRASLLRRNSDVVSLKQLKLDPAILLFAGKPNWGGDFTTGKAPAGVDSWVHAFLPGYSPSRDRAVLRFWFGPTPHGATGTIFLVKQDGKWRIKWHHFSFYV